MEDVGSDDFSIFNACNGFYLDSCATRSSGRVSEPKAKVLRAFLKSDALYSAACGGDFYFNVKPQDTAEAGARLVAQPLFAAATPEWYCNSGVIGKVQSKGETYADYDFAFDQGIKQMRKSQQAEPFFGKRFGRLGLLNFGDNFGSDGMNWDNVEYDLGYSFLQQFRRTGNVDALRMGQDIVLHNMKVDIARIRDGYEWPSHHTGDHSEKLAGLGHTWCEGLWNYYFLTGDRQAARKALGVSNTIAHQVPSLMAAGTPGVGGGRTYGWSVVGLMAAYGATSDPLYLNAAKEVEEVAVRTQHPFRGVGFASEH